MCRCFAVEQCIRLQNSTGIGRKSVVWIGCFCDWDMMGLVIKGCIPESNLMAQRRCYKCQMSYRPIWIVCNHVCSWCSLSMYISIVLFDIVEQCIIVFGGFAVRRNGADLVTWQYLQICAYESGDANWTEWNSVFGTDQVTCGLIKFVRFIIYE